MRRRRGQSGDTLTVGTDALRKFGEAKNIRHRSEKSTNMIDATASDWRVTSDEFKVNAPVEELYYDSKK